MSTEKITPELLEQLKKVPQQWLPSPISRRASSRLAKLGWVQVRETKIVRADHTREKMRMIRITPGGRMALIAVEKAQLLSEGFGPSPPPK